MDLYISSLLLGAAGLGVMALTGLGHHGHGGAAGHVGHTAHLGHTHGGHATAPGRAAPSSARTNTSSVLWAVTSPRFLFSLALGFGAVGELLRPVLGGPLLIAAAVVGAVLFERVIVSPLWNFSMRFASSPAVTLESAITDEATAVTSFDGNGQGIVSIEVDGQIVQILGTLRVDDRLLPRARVRAGQRLRVEDVDAERNRCTVSLL